MTKLTEKALYPILNRDLLLAHPIKGRKPQDLERIFTSKRSEDYVTWNMFQLLQTTPTVRWWSEFIGLLRGDNPDFALAYQPDDLPSLAVWRKCKSPSAYEEKSRIRMAQSDNPGWVARSQNMKSVEGWSEIDMVISGRSYLIFVEAKLESDISLGTTYDPARNQIIRNIDCVLEECKSQTPAFVLLVKDKRPDRDYVRLLREYQRNPTALVEALPHREPEIVRRIASNLAILLWKDVLAFVQHLPDDVGTELKRRIDN